MKLSYLSVIVLLAILSFSLGCQTTPSTSASQPTKFAQAISQTTVLPSATFALATLLPTVTLEPTATPETTSTPTAAPIRLTPTMAPPPACQNSFATITSPAMNSRVSDLIEIRGSASKADMQYWKLEYRSEGSATGVVLMQSDALIINGVLTRLSTKTLPNGVYWLKITVVQKDGNYPLPCEIRITIAN